MDHLNELSDSLPTLMKEVIHIEVCQAPNSVARAVEIEKHVTNYLEDLELHFGDIFKDFSNSEYLQFNVSYITICSDDLNYSTSQIDRYKYRFVVHVYQLTNEGAATEEIEEDEEISAANHWILPSRDFDGMWENLIFDSDVKQELLNYAGTTMLFSDKNIDSNIISCNRVVLLHGPPGTGKTSLCKALAQKLSIRLSNRFRYGQLIEINSHSLFSKWFSESGKLVMKMFQRIQELIDDKEALVFVLIDEVESLTAARAAAVNGSEPSDAIRVVNAVLTQIDHIKKYSNVLILTTSNITGAVDLAFVDRADIKQYIGPPSELAIFSIYHSCIEELKRKNVVVKTHLPDLQTLKMMKFQENDFNSISFRLLDVAKKSYGLSGRTLRKLPFLAYAMHLQSHSKISQKDFIHALSSAVNKQLEDRDKLISESQRQLDIMIPKGSVEEGKKADDEKDAIMVNGFH